MSFQPAHRWNKRTGVFLVHVRRLKSSLKPSRSICEACQRINFENLSAECTIPGQPLQEGFEWQTSYSNITASIEKCAICRFIHKFLFDYADSAGKSLIQALYT